MMKTLFCVVGFLILLVVGAAAQVPNFGSPMVPNASSSGGGGGGTPGGSNTQLQYNNGGSFGGIAGATSNGTNISIANGDLVLPSLSTGTLVNCLGLTSGNVVAGLGSACGSGTITSISSGCGTYTGGSAITTSGTIASAENPVTITSGNFTTAYCGELINYNSASDTSPTLPTAVSIGNGGYLDVCSVQHSLTVTRSSSDTIGGATTYAIGTGTAAAPTCVRFVSNGVSAWSPIPYAGAGGTGNAIFGTTTGNTSGDVVTMSNTTTGIQDSGTALTALAPKASPTFSGTVTMPDSSTWTSGGINSATIGATTAAAGHFTTIVVAGSFTVAVRTASSTSDNISATTDYFVCADNGSNAATENLPSSPATGLTFLIADCAGSAATHSITVTPASGNIDGSGTYVLSTNFQTISVTYTGSIWKAN